jgi:FixJ family two-component response regulator
METSQGTLFVIDDDPNSRNAVAALARSMKINCEPFASAEEFLDRYDPSLRGCALIDYRLEGMDGLQLQERLQALDSTLTVILVSAYADASMTARAMENGALGVIEKPYESDDLGDLVRKGLDRSNPALVSHESQVSDAAAVQTAPRQHIEASNMVEERANGRLEGQKNRGKG